MKPCIYQGDSSLQQGVISTHTLQKFAEHNLQRKLDRAVSRYVGDTKLAQLVGGDK